MDLTKIEKLLEAITEVVKADGPYKEKAEAIKAACSDEDEVNLEEFLGWFE
jgi:hypothetical protein